MQLTKIDLWIVMSDTLIDDEMQKPIQKIRGRKHVEVRYFSDENPSSGVAIAAEIEGRMMSSGALDVRDACTTLRF